MNTLEKYEPITKTESLNKKLLFSILITTLIVTLVILFADNNNYRHLHLLPFSYFLIIVLFSRIFLKPLYEYGLLFYAAQFFIFIRYVLTPLSMVIAKNEFQPGPDPQNYEMTLAIVLMIYELLWVFIAISIAMISGRKKKKFKSEVNYSLFSNKFVIIATTLLFLIILIRTPEYIIPNVRSINDVNIQSVELDSGLLNIISLVFKCSAFLLLLSFTNNKKNLTSFIFSVFILLIFIVLFLDTSRWTMIFMGISGYIVIERLYPRYQRHLRIIFVGILVFFTVYTSMIKFWWVIVGSENPINEVLKHMTTQFQAYFSGPRVVAQSTNIKEIFSSINIQTFVNDFLGSIPILSNFINQDDRINVYFNLYNHRQITTLIMPLVGIGYTYFGIIFAPVFTVFAQWTIISLDIKLLNIKRLEFMFILTYLGLRLSMSMGFNTQSLITSFISPTLPLLLLFLLNQKIYLFRKPGGSNEKTISERNNYNL